MNDEVRCPRCGGAANDGVGCRHLRWKPERGGPVEFAKFVVVTSPYTSGRGFVAASIPETWWESEYDWLLERILTRLDVINGHCFGDPIDLDRLCIDIWHEFAPDPERVIEPRAP